jgi:hypothetical protein
MTETKTIAEIVEQERGFKITNPYEDYLAASILYKSVASKYNNKRGSNLTPKKKKRK